MGFITIYTRGDDFCQQTLRKRCLHLKEFAPTGFIDRRSRENSSVVSPAHNTRQEGVEV